MDGPFADFVSAVANADLTVSGLNVQYEAAGIGDVTFGWEGDFTVNGQNIALDDYPRFDNPYTHVDFDSLVYDIEFRGMSLHLDFDKGVRTVK
jgi:hypothetical protein